MKKMCVIKERRKTAALTWCCDILVPLDQQFNKPVIQKPCASKPRTDSVLAKKKKVAPLFINTT